MTLHFDDFELDLAGHLLARRGRPVPLSPKAFDLLALLVARRPGLVPKADLLAALWPDTFVGDGSLHNLVAELRAALGDSSREPRLVRTVARLGYAFAAEARDESSAAGGGPCLVWGGRELTLPSGETVVGRDADCGVRIDAIAVSRRHCRIVREAGRVSLHDLGSKNGTFLNGERVAAPRVLAHGDEVRLGSVALRYCERPGGASTATEAPR